MGYYPKEPLDLAIGTELDAWANLYDTKRHDGEPDEMLRARLTLDCPRLYARAYEKSVVVNGKTIYPLTPENIVAVFKSVGVEAMERAFRAGRRSAQAEMRRVIGVKSI